MRKTQGAMLCPSCRKLISVTVERCPFCGAKRPGLWGYGPALSQLGARLDPVSLIPPVCIVLYVASLLLDIGAIFHLDGGAFGLLSPSGRALRTLGSTAPLDLLIGRWWTMVTAIYLHGGLLHILFNVMWIRSLAPEVASAFGGARFFVIWTAAGVAGFLLSDGLPILGVGGGHASIGASGAIFGLMAALIVYGRRIGASLMTRQIWTWAIVIGLMGFLLPGVDNLAHIGGFGGGYLAATLFRSGLGRAEGTGTRALAIACFVITAAGFVLSIVTAFLR